MLHFPISFLAALSLFFLSSCKKEISTIPEPPKVYVSETCEVHGNQLYKKSIGAHMDYTKEYWQFLMSRDWNQTHPHAIRDANEHDILEDDLPYHLVCEQCESSFRQEHRAFNPNKNGFRLKLELQDNGYFATDSGDIFYKNIGSILSQAQKKQPWVHLFIRTNTSTPKQYLAVIDQIAKKSGIKLISYHIYDHKDEQSQ